MFHLLHLELPLIVTGYLEFILDGLCGRMKIERAIVWLLAATVSTCHAFHVQPKLAPSTSAAHRYRSSPLYVSIGLGPSNEQKDGDVEAGEGQIDFEIPNHEEYRTSRRSKLDEACDDWFASLLGDSDGNLGAVAEGVRERLVTPVELKNEIELPKDDPEWTPYVSTRLPWTPLTPAYGLEQFGIPIPRRGSEAWRHFDVAGMIAQDYSGEMTVDSGLDYEALLKQSGGWLEDNECLARLVYINGYFMPELSKTSDTAYNMDNVEDDKTDDVTRSYLSRLPDGFSDELVTPVSNGEIMQTSHSELSSPNHNVGEATSQFAINTQQGTACFAALNTVKTRGVAYVHAPAEEPKDDEDEEGEPGLPVLIVNAMTPSGGSSDNSADTGVSCHPRTLVVADENSRLSVVQSFVDLDTDGQTKKPKLHNGYTQIFIKEGANVTHSYLGESGGIVTPGVELSDEAVEKMGIQPPRDLEAARAELLDTHLEAIDVQLMGENAGYQGAVMSVGGSGHVRIGMSATLLQSGSEAVVNGFALSGGTQRTDMKTNIHHIAQGTTSRQIQKNMIGGRATGAFRGRIRVEQSAQQTDSEQLSRTVLLSDKSRAWAVPSLEIIADDVKCSHGSTVSDLSEEELFYLRSRGLGRSMARNLLMYAFAGDICSCVDQAMLGSVDSSQGLQQRIIRRLENLVPQGERAVKGEFQSI